MSPKILIIEEQELVRNEWKTGMEDEGYRVLTAASLEQAQEQLISVHEISLLITDLKVTGMPGIPANDGLAFLKWARAKFPLLSCIYVSEQCEKEMLVKAFRAGVADYIQKPCKFDELLRSVNRISSAYHARTDSEKLISRLEARVQRSEKRFDESFWIASRSPTMSKISDRLVIMRREAMRGSLEQPPVLITGERGSGHVSLAWTIHSGSSRARSGWVMVNCTKCTSASEAERETFEVELFGQEKHSESGASTVSVGALEAATEGTIFFEEIGALSPALQEKLFQTFKNGNFRRVGGTVDLPLNVRLLCSSTIDLSAKVTEGKFSNDFLKYLSGIVLDIPPLRDHLDDIVAVATQFAETAFRAKGKVFHGFNEDAQRALKEYAWPGNTDELVCSIERAALVYDVSRSEPLSPGLLGLFQPGQVKVLPPPPRFEVVKSGVTGIRKLHQPTIPITDTEGYIKWKKDLNRSMEREYLISMLGRCDGNVSLAAREAKMDRSNFLRLLRKNGVKAEIFRKPLLKAA